MEIDKLILNFIWEMLDTRIAKAALKKVSHTVRRLLLPDKLCGSRQGRRMRQKAATGLVGRMRVIVPLFYFFSSLGYSQLLVGR